VTLLFSSAEHGWAVKDWRKKCIGKNQTFTFFKSEVGNVSGGYLEIAWEAEGYGAKDASAFVLSVDHKRKLTHDNTHSVTWFGKDYGPAFGDNSLAIGRNDIMNSEENCYGHTEGADDDCFNTPLD
jgi:hypothetical protein